MGGFSQAAKQIIYDRANGLCVWCHLGELFVFGCWWEFHHRKLRQMGGSRDPRIDHPDNGALAHGRCHNGGPDTIHGNRDEAVSRGLIIPQWAEIPVWSGEAA